MAVKPLVLVIVTFGFNIIGANKVAISQLFNWFVLKESSTFKIADTDKLVLLKSKVVAVVVALVVGVGAQTCKEFNNEIEPNVSKYDFDE
jgi:K+-sensing histidine kinase KdpD